MNKLNELSETEYFTEANKQLLAKRVKACIWRGWGDKPSEQSTEKGLEDALNIVESWGLSNWDFDELREVHKRVGDLRSFDIPANPKAYSELVAKLELVKPIYWKYNKKKGFKYWLTRLKNSQIKRKKCTAMLIKFERKNGLYEDSNSDNDE